MYQFISAWETGAIKLLVYFQKFETKVHYLKVKETSITEKSFNHSIIWIEFNCESDNIEKNTVLGISADSCLVH